MTCQKKHYDLVEKVKTLKSSQAGEWRHKCAGCADELGFKDGQKDEKERIFDAAVSFLKNL